MRGSTSGASDAGGMSFALVLGDCSVATAPPENKTAPIVQRTTGSWYHLLVQRRPYRGHPAVGHPITLCARYRALPPRSRTTSRRRSWSGSQPFGRTSLFRRERRYSFRSLPWTLIFPFAPCASTLTADPRFPRLPA